MVENESQGISRRDLLKRGAALGGAVVWATPVVQTLGMGRAFADTASPVGPAISYIAMIVTCEKDKDGNADGDRHFIKWEVDTTEWEHDPGKDPGCDTISSADYDVMGFGDHMNPWDPPAFVNDRCYEITVPNGCQILKGVTKAGIDECTPIEPVPNAGPIVPVGPGCP